MNVLSTKKHIYIVLEVLATAIRQDSEIKNNNPFVKRRPSLFANDILCIGNSACTFTNSLSVLYDCVVRRVRIPALTIQVKNNHPKGRNMIRNTSQ